MIFMKCMVAGQGSRSVAYAPMTIVLHAEQAIHTDDNRTSPGALLDLRHPAVFYTHSEITP